jgi:hypothetical protein
MHVTTDMYRFWLKSRRWWDGTVRSLATRSEVDHFAGAGKMIARRIFRLFTRSYRPLDGLFEASPLAVAQQGLQVADNSVFGAIGKLARRACGHKCRRWRDGAYSPTPHNTSSCVARVIAT